MTHPHLAHVIQRNVKFWRSAALHWDYMIVQACTTAQPVGALHTSYHISNNLIIILIIYPQAPAVRLTYPIALHCKLSRADHLGADSALWLQPLAARPVV